MTEDLCHLGYTLREAGFLELAALVSGYFLRPQYNLHIGRECGALGQSFIDRALRFGHIKALPRFGNRQPYHICSRDLYELVGEPDNRNRRSHAVDTIRHRLMMLDYVLAQPPQRWLVTAQARTEAVVSLAPAMLFSGPEKMFSLVLTERQPLSLDPAGELRIAFVDDGLRGFSKWERFVERYRPLVHTRGTAAIIYASCIPERLSTAERVFRRMVGEDVGAGGIDRDRLRAYFVARRLFEERQYQSFDKSRIDRLREDQRAFSGEVFEALYQRWRNDGEAALAKCSATTSRFETQQLRFTYSWLSPIRFQERKIRYGPYSGPG